MGRAEGEGGAGLATRSVGTPLTILIVDEARRLDAAPPVASLTGPIVALAGHAAASLSQQTLDVEVPADDAPTCLRAFRLTARPRAEGGAIVVVLGLDGLREVEDALTRHDLVMRATHDAVFDWNVQTQSTWWNPQQYAMLGHSLATTKPSYEAWAASIHPDDKERVATHLGEVLASTASSWASEYRFRRADGTFGVALDRGYIERDADARPLRMIGVMSDVTAERAGTAALRASEERFRQLTSSIDQVFWLVDGAANDTYYVSPAYEKIWGRPIADLYANPLTFLDAIHEDDRARVRALFPPEGNGVYDAVYRIRRPDGAIVWIHDRSYPIHDAAGKAVGVAGVATDITAQHQLEEQLAQAQKMESIGRLAGGIAHDFNNLLTVVLSSIDFLARRYPAEDRPEGDLTPVRDAAERAAKLTSQLLAFASRQVVEPRRIDLNDLTHQMDRLLRRVIGEHIELTTILGTGSGAVLADRSQLEQVLVNLAVNARDAMPDGGRLVVETSIRVLDGAGSAAGLSQGRYVTLSVSDTGVGIPAEVMPHLFEPFFTTKAAGLGTGLGLATCYGVVRQAGGQILVESRPGHGTVFTILLPQLPDDPATLETPALAEVLGGPETILFVEDDAAVRAIGVRILAERGYQLLEASSGPHALRVAAAHAGPIHLLVTDVVMPSMSGPELATRLLELRTSLRVLFTSGHNTEAGFASASEGPRRSFLPKPYVSTTLLAKAREVLDDDARP